MLVEASRTLVTAKMVADAEKAAKAASDALAEAGKAKQASAAALKEAQAQLAVGGASIKDGLIKKRDLADAMQVADEIARRLSPAVAPLNIRLLGPAPAPLVRLRGEHRVQLFLKGTRRAEMRAALQTVLAEMPEIRRRVTLDVDPINVL